ncbi:hypothetical protein [Agrobacterium larrymoorei]|uniref:Uncharacterized protein n=1 Tax=Agrobacterium larrymoorei TaxID=160699 RepID=A0AAF0KDC0_9HYPH|nr:hypothetical protein [Agrobacterium larrymoorei]WHA39747.1 hypothetical protein CFBP5477_007735 [Agrobacterium larrymoorei]
MSGHKAIQATRSCRWSQFALIASLFLMSDAQQSKAEMFRLETFVDASDDSCKYSISRPDWKARVNDLLRDIVETNIQHVRLVQDGSIVLSNVGRGHMVKFKTVYKGMAVDGNGGGEMVHEIVEVEGLAFMGTDKLVVKVTKSNSPLKTYLSGKFITCEPMSVPGDIPLSLDDMKKLEINKVRQAELKFGDAVDDLSRIGVKAVSEPLGKIAGFVVDDTIGQSLEENKARRHERLNTKSLSFVEKERAANAERTAICNVLWGSGGC